jgi:hypothetical protein
VTKNFPDWHVLHVAYSTPISVAAVVRKNFDLYCFISKPLPAEARHIRYKRRYLGQKCNFKKDSIIFAIFVTLCKYNFDHFSAQLIQPSLKK